MAKFGRDFSTLMKGAEWISINHEQLTKKKIKRYGNLTRYLNIIYGKDNWRFFYIANNKQLNEEETLNFLFDSFSNYYNKQKESVKSWIKEIEFSVSQADIDGLREDIIAYNILKLITESFLKFIGTLSEIEIIPNTSEMRNYANLDTFEEEHGLCVKVERRYWRGDGRYYEEQFWVPLKRLGYVKEPCSSITFDEAMKII
jgi:hypothetical protein